MRVTTKDIKALARLLKAEVVRDHRANHYGRIVALRDSQAGSRLAFKQLQPNGRALIIELSLQGDGLSGLM